MLLSKPASELAPHVLEEALRGDIDAWRSVWRIASRRGDDELEDRLLSVRRGRALIDLLAPIALGLVQRAADASVSQRTRRKGALRLTRVLHRAEWPVFVCQSQPWEATRIVHIGLCGARPFMKLSPESAAWDLVRGGLCRRCHRSLVARSDAPT